MEIRQVQNHFSFIKICLILINKIHSLSKINHSFVLQMYKFVYSNLKKQSVSSLKNINFGGYNENSCYIC